jgi:DNA polymerase elongation subunit (family B)
MYISAQTTYDRSRVKVWERTKEGRVLQEYPSPLFFYVEDEDGKDQDYKGNKLQRLEFEEYDQYYNTAKRLKSSGKKVFESDIPLEYKVLSNHYYNDIEGTINVSFYDIEIDYDKTRGMPDIYNEPYAPINAISIYHKYSDKMIVLAVPPRPDITLASISKETRAIAEIRLFRTEIALLLAFLDEIEDTDLLSGWNSEGFDDIYVYNRIKMVLGDKHAHRLSFEGARKPYFQEKADKHKTKKNILVTSGRILLDLMQVMIKFEPGERDSFALEAVAEEILTDMPKLTYEGSLADLYKNDFDFFLKYNARDCEILKGLEQKKGYIYLSLLLAHMDSGLVKDVLGTIRLAEMAITNYCHHVLNIRVPDKQIDGDGSGEKFGGAIVLPPMIGEHKNIASIDVNSLYPSSMMSVNISYDTLLGQFTDNHKAFEEIANKSDKELTLVFDDGNVDVLPAKEWSKLFTEMKWSISGFGTVFSLHKFGIIPSLLKEWFTKRKQLKKQAFSALDNYNKCTDKEGTQAKKYYDEYQYYDLMQTVFKLKLNSTYGACGNRFFRWYDVRLAESTTKTGREVLFHMTKVVGQVLEGQYYYPNNSVIAGDTDSNYFKTHETDIELASQTAKKVAKAINDSFEEFCKEKFLLCDEFLGLFQVSQEVVAANSIFTHGKKHYMMHVVEKDGNKVDKMVVKGLQIKKTSTPKAMRKLLTDHFERYLKGTPWKEIGLSLLENREKILVDTDIEMLGIPQKINGLETYHDAYINNTKGITVPGGCRAAYYWNECLTTYGDKESMKMVSGIRGRKFYLKTESKKDKHKSIAIPVDIDIVPGWFKEHILPRVDKKMQIERLMDNVCESLLDAIGQILPTRKILLLDELVEYE